MELSICQLVRKLLGRWYINSLSEIDIFMLEINGIEHECLI
ncbi:hypothetical protein [Clostridium intestinale]|nr:hypothetical protein [Clostridium intestinale]